MGVFTYFCVVKNDKNEHVCVLSDTYNIYIYIYRERERDYIYLHIYT